MILSITKRLFRAKRRLCVFHNRIDTNRKTLFFIHGLSGSAINWQAQFRTFSDRYNIVAYDLYGHGQSGQPDKNVECSMLQSVLDAQSIIEYFELRNITIIAHGYGALISLLLYQNCPERVRKQLLISPMSYQTLGRVPWYLRWPFSTGYRFLRLTKMQASEKGNNSLVLPKIWIVRSYYHAAIALPKLVVEQSKVGIKTAVLRSDRQALNKRKRIDEFYKIFYRAKIKRLENSSLFPMQQAKQQVNYFLAQTIDELNLNAFRNLVFEGAGIRGIAYSGAISALESLGVLKNIHRFAGTSAGAIYAIFLAIGFNAKEIEGIVSHLDYGIFTEENGNFIRNSTRLLTDFGWYRSDFFIDHMAELIEQKLPDRTVNFKQLKALTGNNLYIVGTNLSQSCAEVYSVENTPDMTILDALKISTCIPMLFTAGKRKEGTQEHVLIDGGLVWNCPLELFDAPNYLSNPLNIISDQSNKSGNISNLETLGFRLDPADDPLRAMRREPKPYQKIGNIFDFTREFWKFYTMSAMKRHLAYNDWCRVVFVDTLDVIGTNFDITEEDIEHLIEQGKKGVYQHFAWRMGKNGVRFPQ